MPRGLHATISLRLDVEDRDRTEEPQFAACLYQQEAFSLTREDVLRLQTMARDALAQVLAALLQEGAAKANEKRDKPKV